MSIGRPDAGSRLGWAARRYALLAVAVVIVFAVVGAVSARNDDPRSGMYESQALIAAADLQIRPEQFPRTASIIFDSGPVAEGTASRLGLDTAPSDMVPDVIELDPVEDTVLAQIEARDRDPETAVQLANTAAELMLEELNALGAGFGSFVLVAPAVLPEEPVAAPGRASTLLFAIAAGLVFAGGLIGLIVALRRPVLTALEAGDLAGAPVIGSIALPARGDLPAVQAVPGLSAMIKQVLPERQGRAVFVSVKGGAGSRSSVALLFARGLARSGPVAFVASPDAPVTDPGSPNIAVADEARAIKELHDLPVVIDGPSAAVLDVPQFLPADARVVLVVPEGVPEAVVEAAAGQFLEGELSGVVFVPRRGGVLSRTGTGEHPR